ncbi:class I SAM-dependent methyltransferase [uncultured Ruegeria sp.]|uniref:class I SAM-dependent methyltransferase n=1 Tax=uncultured Ruegeria sp. TaxID=259304 RepID=UPI002609E334|nr:class I SAM-dependent methyltransferase [uncultured Ruegeria sp.]
MQIANEDQAEYWSNSPSGAKWLTYEDQLDHMMAPVIDLILKHADLNKGMRVLDIGCGTGVSSLAAARRVGADGHILGADISQPFLDRAAQRAKESGLGNVDFQRADAQVTQFPEAGRDAAISRFGVMFFDDSIAAFKNIARALVPNGQMTFAAWGPLADNPWFRIPHIAATNRLGHPPKVDRYAPGPLAFHDLDHVIGMMTEAGLKDVRAHAIPIGLNFLDTIEKTATLCTRVGPAARVISHFDGSKEDVSVIRQAVSEEFRPMLTDQAGLPAVINLYQARRAS